jgi:oligopeptide/dipeptide ABC transporter ATP-binding protein
VNQPDSTPASPPHLLEVRDLSVSFATPEGRKPVLQEVSFTLKQKSCLSLVGESGCGKTVTALSVMGLLPPRVARLESGSIHFKGKDLLLGRSKNLRRIRGKEIAMIFQDAQSAMNPYLRVSEQLTEGVRHHEGLSQKAALERAVHLLEEVGIADAGSRIHDFPHQFSGGMLQRIMIAMALMTSPDLLLADEPTSALDVTIQAQTLELFDRVREKRSAAMILITHDLGVVAGRSDRIAVMYAGRIVESGPTAEVLEAPAHPYMEALLRSNPSMETGKKIRLTELPGQPPAPGDRPAGCAFAPRCPKVLKKCHEENPPFEEKSAGHGSACWLE